jgi:hypothetical protein
LLHFRELKNLKTIRMKKVLLSLITLFFSASLTATVSVVSQTNITCPGMCNGAVTLSVTGGIMPYTLSTIMGPSTSCLLPPYPPFNSNTITVSGLCACSYSFQVKDAGATIVGTVVVTFTAPPPIVASFSVQNVCCNGACNGAVYAFVTGGTGPYAYNWFPTGPSGPSYTAACAGTYDLCVTDSKGCSKCQVATVTQPPVYSLSSSITAASCPTCCNGGVNVTGSGGTPPYTYTIAPGFTTNPSGSFSNLCPGSYTVCSMDNGCCLTCTSVTVPTGSTTSVKNLASKDDIVFIYPNPSHGTLYLKSLVDLSEATYEVHDLLGKKIEHGEANEFSKMAPLKDGVYFITIRNKECAVISRKKVIIER